MEKLSVGQRQPTENSNFPRACLGALQSEGFNILAYLKGIYDIFVENCSFMEQDLSETLLLKRLIGKFLWGQDFFFFFFNLTSLTIGFHYLTQGNNLEANW